MTELSRLQPPLLEFKAWPKIGRYSKASMVITEKIDGTNGAVGIMPVSPGMEGHPDLSSPAVTIVETDDDAKFMVYAQSRKRILTVEDDNYGFARWVHDNAETLVMDLGYGLNFGEWWGQGIQRNYGLDHKNFSLFNTFRYPPSEEELFATPHLSVVPELYRGPLDTEQVELEFGDLGTFGSAAVKGWMMPEGIVIHVPDLGGRWKRTFDRNDQHKYLSQERAPEVNAA